jgi:hypothetical protein
VLEKGENYPEDKIVKLKKNFHIDYEQRFNIPIAEDYIDLKKNSELFFYFINGRTPSEADAKRMNAMIHFDSKYFSDFSEVLRQRSCSITKKSKVDQVVNRLYQVDKKPVFKQKNLQSMGSVSPSPRRSTSQTKGGFQSSIAGTSRSKPQGPKKSSSNNRMQSSNQSSSVLRQTSRTRPSSPINSILERLSGHQTQEQKDVWKNNAERCVQRMRKRTTEKENDRHAQNMTRQSKLQPGTSTDEDFREISNLNYTNYQRGLSVEYSKKRTKEKLQDQKAAIMNNINQAVNKNAIDRDAHPHSRLSTSQQRMSFAKQPSKDVPATMNIRSVEDQGYESGLLESTDEIYN